MNGDDEDRRAICVWRLILHVCFAVMMRLSFFSLFVNLKTFIEGSIFFSLSKSDHWLEIPRGFFCLDTCLDVLDYYFFCSDEGWKNFFDFTSP